MRRKSLNLLLAAVSAGAALALLSIVKSWWPQPIQAFGGRQQWHDGTDFAAFYAAAKAIAQGEGDRIYDVDYIGPIERQAAPQFPPDRVLPYLNPPFFALTLTPLSSLPFQDTYRVWTVLNLTVLAAICLLAWQMLSARPRRERWLTLAGIVSLLPVTTVLQEGQFSLILVLSWLATLFSLRQGKDWAAGLALTPMLLKPELVLPVIAILVWKRQWSVLTTFLPATGLLVLVSVVVIGVPAAIDYPRYVIEIASRDGYGTNT